jgi:hypothetical protein
VHHESAARRLLGIGGQAAADPVRPTPAASPAVKANGSRGRKRDSEVLRKLHYCWDKKAAGKTLAQIVELARSSAMDDPPRTPANVSEYVRRFNTLLAKAAAGNPTALRDFAGAGLDAATLIARFSAEK